MKILWGSPLPPVRSGVSDYAIELLTELGTMASIRVLTPPGWVKTRDWPLADTVTMVPAATRAEDDEVSLIHLGNNPHHLWLLSRLAAPRTVVVLHDLVLHHLLVEATASKGRHDRLDDALVGAHGERGRAIARARSVGLVGHRDPFLFPARSGFLEHAAGIIVHSRWAEAAIARECPQIPCLRVGLAVADPGRVDRESERGRLGLAVDDIVLMHLGFLTPEKGLEQVFTGFAAAVRSGVQARLLLVGEGSDTGEVRAAASSVGVGDRIGATGWVAGGDFPRVPAAADLGIVLRTPSAGETSAAAVRFLACGSPVAVHGARQFLEWPEAAAPRITPGPSAPAEVARLLALAAARGNAWAERRSAARAAYEASHRPGDAAATIVEFLERLF
jgi:glycosyltransferase involved in cell wall biosynthesis